MQIIFLLVLSYLLGSIPFSHIFPKLKGKEVSQEGTKNVGASNALIVAGPLAGALALIGDVLKGFLAVFIALRLNQPEIMVALCAILVIVGHDFSMFLKFNGGKGVATTLGVLFALDPIFTLIIILIWILVIAVSQYLIPSTLFMFLALPIFFVVLGKSGFYVFFSLVACGLALYAHRMDIKRFLDGKEIKVSQSLSHFFNK